MPPNWIEANHGDKDLSNRGGGKESLILEIGKPALGELLQLLF
jgi:hypothetical protein